MNIKFYGSKRGEEIVIFKNARERERERERERDVFNNFLNKTCQDIVSKKMYNAVLDRIHLG